MDGFSDLNLFALVARNRNLAAAARELGVTPSSRNWSSASVCG
jgi:LysR family transcriptional activator of dmlA